MAFEKIRSKLTMANGDMPSQLGRNDPCRCGSGKKYKKCHLPQDEEAERKRLVKAEIPKLEPEEEKKRDHKAADNKTKGNQPPVHAPEKKPGFMRGIFNRKVGGG